MNKEIDYYIRLKVREYFREHVKELDDRGKQLVDYVVAEERKLNNILAQFDKYLTVGGEVKDGKRIGKR